MRARTRSFWLSLAVLGASGSLGFDGSFQGCGGSASTPPVEVPTATIECNVDSDCTPSSMCATSYCQFGACVETPAAPDADRDGYEAVPCGRDCDDESPSTYPDALESCNGVDDDCDSNVDEGASVWPTVYEAPVETLFAAPMEAGTHPGVLLVSAVTGGLLCQWLSVGVEPRADSVVVSASSSDVLVTGARVDGQHVQLVFADRAARSLQRFELGLDYNESAGPDLSASRVSTLASGVDVTGLDAAMSTLGLVTLVATEDGAHTLYSGTTSRGFPVAEGTPVAIAIRGGDSILATSPTHVLGLAGSGTTSFEVDLPDMANLVETPFAVVQASAYAFARTPEQSGLVVGIDLDTNATIRIPWPTEESPEIAAGSGGFVTTYVSAENVLSAEFWSSEGLPVRDPVGVYGFSAGRRWVLPVTNGYAIVGPAMSTATTQVAVLGCATF